MGEGSSQGVYWVSDYKLNTLMCETHIGLRAAQNIKEIDENLARGELSPAERSANEHERKRLYELLHPETRQAAAREPCGQFGHTVTPR
jgi:hypothetical protein